jgi:hypothetical protein
MRKLGLAALTALLLPCAQPAFAKPQSCTSANAKPVELASVALNPSSYAGECVRLKGLWAGPALYSSPDGYYLAGAIVSDLAPDNPLRAYRIGLYPNGAQAETAAKSQVHIEASDADIIGTVGMCEEFWQAGLIVTGYCHYSHGAILSASHISYKPRRLVRLTDDAARARVGNLRPMAANSPERPGTEQAMRRWLADVRARNAADYAALTDWVGDLDSGRPGEINYQVMKAPWSSFAELRGGAGERQSRIFEILDRSRAPVRPDPDNLAEFCVCVVGDCTGKWPISVSDAAYAPTRPYVCAVTQAAYRKPDGERHVRVDMDFRDIDEPR